MPRQSKLKFFQARSAFWRKLAKWLAHPKPEHLPHEIENLEQSPHVRAFRRKEDERYMKLQRHLGNI